MPSLISIKDLDKETLVKICYRALEIKKNGFQESLKSKIVATLFFEPSTRTCMSFETAIYRLGAQALRFPTDNSSLKKGESIEDTIRMAASYADCVVIRHPQEGLVLWAQKFCECPLINGGDGKNEHPTQTILDLVTLFEDRESLDGITITIAGDLKHSRTVTSLLHALSFFDLKIILAAPQNFELSSSSRTIISSQIICETENLSEALDTDYFYMTRLQKERFDGITGIETKDYWVVDLEKCKTYGRDSMKIMHPLPRVDEISVDLDDSPYQLYFTQASNGVYARIAVLEYVLGYL